MQQGRYKVSDPLGVSQIYEFQTDSSGKVVFATWYMCHDLEARRYRGGRGRVKARPARRRPDPDLPF